VLTAPTPGGARCAPARTRATIRAIADVSKLGNVEICRDSANRTIDDESLLGDVEIHQGSADQVFRLGDDVFEIRKVVKGILHPTMAILDGSGELLRSEWGWEQAEVEVLGQHALLPLLATVLKWTLTND